MEWWMQPRWLVVPNQEKFDNWISEFEFSNSTVTFILCGKGFCFLSFGIIPFSHVYTTSKPPWYRYFAGKPFGFKVFDQIGSHQYSQLDEKKKCFAWKNAKEVVQHLGTGWFVIVTNSALHPHGRRGRGGGVGGNFCRKILAGTVF